MPALRFVDADGVPLLGAGHEVGWVQLPLGVGAAAGRRRPTSAGHDASRVEDEPTPAGRSAANGFRGRRSTAGRTAAARTPGGSTASTCCASPARRERLAGTDRQRRRTRVERRMAHEAAGVLPLARARPRPTRRPRARRECRARQGRTGSSSYAANASSPRANEPESHTARRLDDRRGRLDHCRAPVRRRRRTPRPSPDRRAADSSRRARAPWSGSGAARTRAMSTASWALPWAAGKARLTSSTCRTSFPQEHGNKTDVRWLALRGADGAGLLVSAPTPVEAKATHYSDATLDRRGTRSTSYAMMSRT